MKRFLPKFAGLPPFSHRFSAEVRVRAVLAAAGRRGGRGEGLQRGAQRGGGEPLLKAKQQQKKDIYF